MNSTTSWNSPRPSYSDTRARSRTCSPFSGLNRSRALRLRNMAQRTCAPASLREKYQCPDAGQTKLEISPSTQTQSKWLSSSVLALRLSWLTLSVGALKEFEEDTE